MTATNISLSTNLVYAPSGVGKTSLLATAVRYYARKTGKPCRWYAGDGGSWGVADSLIRDGVIEPLDIGLYVDKREDGTFGFPWEVIQDIARGYWPADLGNPASKWEPPRVTMYGAVCPKCKTVKYGPSRDRPPLAPIAAGQPAPVAPITTVMCACASPATACILKARLDPNPANDLTRFCLTVFEGLTAFGDKMLANVGYRIAKGERMGEDAPIKFTDGSAFIGGANRAGYMMAQMRLRDAVEASRSLPGQFVIWTATKELGVDDDRGQSKVKVYGPKLPGKAATADVPRWFGNTFALHNWNGQRRLHLTEFRESADEPPTLAKTRIPPHVLGTPCTISGVRYETVPSCVDYRFDDKWLLGEVLNMIDAKVEEARAGEADWMGEWKGKQVRTGEEGATVTPITKRG